MGMRLYVMTSFNYLKSPPPSWFATLALCGALIVAALAGFAPHAGWKIGPTHSRAAISLQAPPVQYHRAATFRVIPLHRRHSNFAPRATVRIRHPLPRRSTANHLQPAPAPRFGPVSTQAAVLRLKRRVRISVLGIVTGSRSSALILLGGKTQVVTVGDLIGGERITDIRNGRIALSNRQILALGEVSK
ncbi:MAG: hypothetical protein M3160_07525 [Candidatus Eremiobacteraeota bacterium]|nr:hypothetical protein [Candidatus Eremiobacteraeota bacterium]